MNHISLKEYAQYVAKVRKYVSKNISLEEAVTRAVDECIEENQIRKKLKKGKPIEQIADELEEAVTTIQRIIEETKKEN